MAKVYVETESMSKEEVVQLLVDKDKLIEKLEHFKFFTLKAYEHHKVSDTSKINRDKLKGYADEMEIVILTNKL